MKYLKILAVLFVFGAFVTCNKDDDDPKENCIKCDEGSGITEVELEICRTGTDQITITTRNKTTGRPLQKEQI